MGRAKRRGLGSWASPIESIRERRGLISEDYGTEEDVHVAHAFDTEDEACKWVT